jgi:hypothetical protein
MKKTAFLLASLVAVLSAPAQTKAEGDKYLAGWKCILETEVRSDLARFLELQGRSVGSEKDFSVIYSGNADWNTFKLYLAYSKKALGVDNDFVGYDVGLNGFGMTLILPFFSANIGASIAAGQNT